ncbi:MAG TPA: YhjD/YihY/BrkB family envelope integrity protein [Actinomycetota bacterium]
MDIAAPIRKLDGFQRTHPWMGFPLAVVKRFGDSGAGSLAAALAYYGFFSLFPLLMVFTSLAGIILRDRPDLQDQLLDSALAQFPVIGTQIRSNVGQIDGSGLTLAIGIVLALWAGLGAVRAAQVAMDTIWDVPRKHRRGTPASIAMALAMLGVLGVFVLGGAVLAGLATTASGTAGSLVALAGSAVLNVVLFAVAYRVLTAADLTWRQVLPGACLAGLGWTVLLSLGGWIVADRVSSSSDVYGTFALVIGLLAWIYLGAQLTLYGAEVNAVQQGRLWPRSLQGELTEADRRALRRSARQEERKEEEIVDVTFGDDGDPKASDPTVGSGATRTTTAERRSVAAVARSVIDGVTQLFRHEVELAKIEATEAIAVRAQAIGLLAAGGVLALYALGYLAASGAAALDIVLPAWASRLIVAGVFIIGGAILFLAGRAAMRSAGGVEQTQATVKEDVQWAKQQIAR